MDFNFDLNLGIPRRIAQTVTRASSVSMEPQVIMSPAPPKDEETGKSMGHTNVAINKAALVALGLIENTYVQVRRIFKTMEKTPTLALLIIPKEGVILAKGEKQNHTTSDLYLVNVTDFPAERKVKDPIKLTNTGEFASKKIYDFIGLFFGLSGEEATVFNAEAVELQGVKTIKLSISSDQTVGEAVEESETDENDGDGVLNVEATEQPAVNEVSTSLNSEQDSSDGNMPW